MTKLLVVLPVITPTYADICVESILRPDSAFGIHRDDVLVVDNSKDGFAHKYGLRTYRDADGHNLGVARSWNVGVDEVLERGLDYLVILSCTVQFGPILHTTWLRQMEEFWGSRVVEHNALSWKLIALHRTIFEKVGRFDPALYPAYFEQTDLCRRLHLVGWEQGFIRVWCNAMAMAVAGHIGAVNCPAEPLLKHLAAKWGGKKGEETFVQPWGDKPLDYIVEEPIEVLAERYRLGTRGRDWW